MFLVNKSIYIVLGCVCFSVCVSVPLLLEPLDLCLSDRQHLLYKTIIIWWQTALIGSFTTHVTASILWQQASNILSFGKQQSYQLTGHIYLHILTIDINLPATGTIFHSACMMEVSQVHHKIHLPEKIQWNSHMIVKRSRTLCKRNQTF